MEPTLYKNLLSVCLTHKRRYLLGVVLVALSNLLLIGNPLIFRKAVMSFESAPDNHSLSMWVLSLLGVTLLASLFKYQMRMVFIEISRLVESHVRSLIFSRIQKQSASFFDRHRIGSLMSRMTNDLAAYREVMGPGIMYPTFFFTLVIPALIALYAISVPMAFLSTLPILVLPLLMLLLRKQTYQISIDVQKALGDLSTMAQEHYAGIRIVKAYAIEKPTLNRFEKLSQRFVSLNMRLSCIRGIIFPFLGLLTKLTTVILVFFMGWIVYRQWDVLSTADFVSFMWIQSYLFIPVLMLGWTLPLYVHGSAAYKRLLDIYQEPIEVKDRPQAFKTVPETADISFHNLTFSYPKMNEPSIRDVSFTLKQGEFIGITGPVGSGKTTLLRLLAREYDIPHGMILFDGQEIHKYQVQAVLNHIAYVEQNPFLFSATIEENLLYGNARATKQQLIQACKEADLYETILSFPKGFDTFVGERGVTLSGGQKQRLALARALLVDKPVILLDDVFSAVDAETESHLFKTIKQKGAGKTVVIITHRSSVLEQMDRVLYMINGSLVEDGTPKQLKHIHGHYSALVELQQLSS